MFGTKLELFSKIYYNSLEYPLPQKFFFNPDDVPLWVRILMEKNYLAAKQGSKDYQTNGVEIYIYTSHDVEVSSEQIKQALLQIRARRQTDEPLRIADIGAGNNALVKQHNKNPAIRAMGVGAEKMTEEPDDSLTIANAEFLAQIKGFNNFDAIHSRYTFIHFENPAKALIEAYRALKPNGILFINRLYFKGMDGWHVDLLRYLQKDGYQVVANVDRSVYSSGQEQLVGFAIVKTKPDLKLPLQYGKEAKNVNYTASEVLLNYRKEIRGKESKATSDETLNLELTALLCDAKLSPGERNKKIKTLVAQMNTEQKENNLELLKANRVLWNDFLWIANGELSADKLTVHTTQRGWSVNPELALIQVKAVAALQIEIEQLELGMKDFYERHLGIKLKTYEADKEVTSRTEAPHSDPHLDQTALSGLIKSSLPELKF